jgi:prephenate dehydratase
MRVAYLGPAGTFTEDALRAAGGGDHEPVLATTVPEAIEAVRAGRADRALVPFENSIEGSVRPALDTLAEVAGEVTIVGEHDHRVRISLIAREEIALADIAEVLSHPQPLAQAARFLRAEVPNAVTRAVESTAVAARIVSEKDEPLAALAGRSAAELYGCTVLREGVEDEGGNVTRFVWVAPAGTQAEGPGAWKTSLVFSELGEDHPGALVAALLEFSSRGVNLTRIESRPRRKELGRYMFFIDAEGALDDVSVAAAVEGLRSQAESVDILGSYPVAANPAE